MPDYKVKQGDCIESIAFRHGLFWETIWNHPMNQQVRTVRKDPNVLFPGDKVFVPNKRPKEEPGATEQRYRFRRKGVPSKLRVIFKEKDKPRVNVPYILEVDRELFSGRTDAQGQIQHLIPPNAKRGRLILGEDGNEEYPLQFGEIDPITEVSGVQERLRNLGFYHGPVDAKMGPQTIQAIKDFQTKHGLTVNGQVDEATRNKLTSEYGC